MKTVKQYEQETKTNVPNYYLYNDDYVTPSLQVISVPLTPTGRVSSKRPHIVIIRKRGMYKDMDLEQAFEAADSLYSKDRLPKGYQWSETLIQHNFWNRKGEK